MKSNSFIIKIAIALLVVPTLALAKPPMGENRKPPQEAFDACESKAADDSCEVNTPRGDTLSGTCKTPPQQEVLVCVPRKR